MPTGKKSRIDNYDSKIFGSLWRARRPLSLKKLSARTDISWPTVKKRVIKLKDFGVVDIKKSQSKTSVFIDPRFMKKSKKKK